MKNKNLINVILIVLVCLQIVTGCQNQNSLSQSIEQQNRGEMNVANASDPKKRDEYEKKGEIVWDGKTDEKIIALTFDDGPDPTETAEILDVLKNHHAKATFFVIGKIAEKHPEMIQREIVEGHEVANHTYSHPMFSNYNFNLGKLVDEVKTTDRIIQNIVGASPTLFRPPGGFYNDQLVQAMREAGYTVVLWSWHQDTADWRKPGVHNIVNKVVRNARGGDIILFHDRVHGNSQTATALKQILPELSKQGFRFVTVSDLLRTGRVKAVQDGNKR